MVKNLQSVGLLYRNKWHYEWKAVQLCIALKPGLGYAMMGYVLGIIPLGMGNFFYKQLAKRRLLISRRLIKDACLLPAAFYPNNSKSKIQLSPNILAQKKG